MTRSLPLLPVVFGLLLIPLSGAAHDDDLTDHDHALAARQAAAIRPLAELLGPVEAAHRGRVIGVELDDEDGRLVYELRLIRADGTLSEITLDAATGQLLEVEEAEDDDHGDRPRPPAPKAERP